MRRFLSLVILQFDVIMHVYLYSCVLCLPMNVLQFRWSPVHLAAYYGQLQAVTVLLQRYNCQPDQKERVRSVHCTYVYA